MKRLAVNLGPILNSLLSKDLASVPTARPLWMLAVAAPSLRKIIDHIKEGEFTAGTVVVSGTDKAIDAVKLMLNDGHVPYVVEHIEP